ncbi:MAG: YkgJ family cysteine cluster protein [Candidatus Bathyarchaeia archaeon]|jgi:Fe-S-cluster containining protein
MIAMIDTCYLHLEFKAKSGDWSINLPFLCTKCGVCCKLDDFLAAGEVKALAQHPKIQAELKKLYDELAVLFEQGEDKYDDYVMHTACPFLKNKLCTIYEIRPEGCRQFPNTPFAMLSEDCEALDRFKKQRLTLRRGRKSQEAFHSTGEAIVPAKATKAQYQKCIAQLKQAGITKEELNLFRSLNEKRSI